jgi:uncharacterized cofD-like protein
LHKSVINDLRKTRYSPLDLLPQNSLREKFVDLVIQGVPEGVYEDAQASLAQLREKLIGSEADDAKVVIFGGGTGLSNILGGDSRRSDWVEAPFNGLKKQFPNTRSIVCITDNGGSTGELLKDLPLIAIGDIRHVLLSSIQLCNLQKKYSLDSQEAHKAVSVLSTLFNLRFSGPLVQNDARLTSCLVKLRNLPTSLENYLQYLIKFLFEDARLTKTLLRSHCLGNLLCAAAIYRELSVTDAPTHLNVEKQLMDGAVCSGLNSLSRVLGCGEDAVLPCTPTPAQLRVLYSNGVEITGEHKLGVVDRGVPIESIDVDYCDVPVVYPEMTEAIESADIIIFAPGSLYSSIIPVLRVPGLASSVRKNDKALKVLVSNLWVQEGETDLSSVDPARNFYVSDMLDAYEKNIPGGTAGLFNEILCVSLKDIPASILQRYAVEGKMPIYLDQENLIQRNCYPVECDIFSKKALVQRGVIQHDPSRLALAIKALYSGHCGFSYESHDQVIQKQKADSTSGLIESNTYCIYPHEKFSAIKNRLKNLEVIFVGSHAGLTSDFIKNAIAEILWDHSVVPLSHLQYFKDIHCIDQENWDRDQKWDNVFSFFDLNDRCIKIRTDQVLDKGSLEVGFMIALGESLLGNYASSKVMENININSIHLGRVYHLHLSDDDARICYFSGEQLKTFLLLSRMCPTVDPHHYTRLINSNEGFTPPGLHMGLLYAWYIDNRFATHIEYKMSVLKINRSGLIPEQLKMASRRRNMIQFFREVVFGRPAKKLF